MSTIMCELIGFQRPASMFGFACSICNTSSTENILPRNSCFTQILHALFVKAVPSMSQHTEKMLFLVTAFCGNSKLHSETCFARQRQSITFAEAWSTASQMRPQEQVWNGMSQGRRLQLRCVCFARAYVSRKGKRTGKLAHTCIMNYYQYYYYSGLILS